jgi:hypothetical protein
MGKKESIVENKTNISIAKKSAAFNGIFLKQTTCCNRAMNKGMQESELNVYLKTENINRVQGFNIPISNDLRIIIDNQVAVT